MQVENPMLTDANLSLGFQKMMEGFTHGSDKTEEERGQDAAMSSQLLQLKWQMFYVQKTQQELASAIIQLSTMILSSPQITNQLTQPSPLPQGPTKLSKRKRGNHSCEISHQKMSKVGDQMSPSLESSRLFEPSPQLFHCDACIQGQDFKPLDGQMNCILQSPDTKFTTKLETPQPNDLLKRRPSSRNHSEQPIFNMQQSPLDLYVSLFLSSLENKTASPVASNDFPNLTMGQFQETALDLVTHSRPGAVDADCEDFKFNPMEDSSTIIERPRPTLSQPAMNISSESGLGDLSRPSSHHGSTYFIKRTEDPRLYEQPPVADWTHAMLSPEKDKAVVILNPNEAKEMFVGGDPNVRLPVWIYKKCIYLVGREQKRPTARLCLCLLQSLFSLRYLVCHNYSGSRHKRPIDPIVMKAVLKQSLLQFGHSLGDNFTKGKLRDYLNNAFRVMAFRRRRGDRVKSPFWNDAGDPILTLDPPNEFRLNDLILTKVLPLQ